MCLGLGFEARKEGREKRMGGGGVNRVREEREAVKLEKIWSFYTRLLR